MTRAAELMGHTERVLQTCLSPDTSTLVSAGADETLRLWKAFTPDPAKKKEQAKAKGAVSSLRMGIR
jgi:cell division cycle protein 20 (cofactor of APC complex)